MNHAYHSATTFIPSILFFESDFYQYTYLMHSFEVLISIPSYVYLKFDFSTTLLMKM